MDSKTRLKLLLAQHHARKAEQAKAAATVAQKDLANVKFAALNDATTLTTTDATIAKPFNEQQQEAIDLAATGKFFCLIGPAGSGKTHTAKGIISQCMRKHGIQPNSSYDGVFAILCYTRRASRNAAKHLKEVGAQNFCLTSHKFLEYALQPYTYEDEEGDLIESKRYMPQRTEHNPIHQCKLIGIDEASMLDTKLFSELQAAAPNARFFFIGDLNQLTPAFGDGILGHALAQCPVVELTKIYRQAMESPIVAFQHNFVLAHKKVATCQLEEITSKATENEGLEFLAFKKEYPDGFLMSKAFTSYIIKQLKAGLYDPLQDTILIPFNKSFGSVAINREIAQILGDERQATVHEILAGRETKYFAVDDFVMFEKRECLIVDIRKNEKYHGTEPQPASKTLLRNGRESGKVATGCAIAALGAEDFALEAWQEKGEAEGRQASHIITLNDLDNDITYEIQTSKDIAGLDFAYCMTGHKAQGSQWRKVWCVLTNHHSNMLTREMLYTSMTRAEKKCTVIYSGPSRAGKSDHSINKCIERGQIPGKTWQQKAEFFRGKGIYVIKQPKY